MGTALSSPVELIRVQRHGSVCFRAAVGEVQGWRRDHEDAHQISCGVSSGSFWVLDGHGGTFASEFGAPALAQEFPAEDGSALPSDESAQEGFATVDKKLYEEIEADRQRESGSTVIGSVAMRQGDGTYTIKLLNCGDSRGLVVRGPDEREASAASVSVELPRHIAEVKVEGDAGERKLQWPLVAETVDHKPSYPTEKARIVAAGGFVSDEEPARVDGNLAVSRGIGDFEYKSDQTRSAAEQKVSNIPDIYSVSGVPPGSLCILACDGVWDVLTSIHVASFVRDRLAEKADLGDICEALISESLREGSKDNITIMIVHLVDGSDWASEKDEMKNFDKYDHKYKQSKACQGEGGGSAPTPTLDDDAFKSAEKFLKRTGFAQEPMPCSNCNRWLMEMNQCPCKTVYYCRRECQKRGWKAHKPYCQFKPDPVATTPSSPGGKSPKASAGRKT